MPLRRLVVPLVVPLAAVVVLAGCASQEQQKVNSVEADRAITALQDSGTLPPGVSVGGAYYADTMTDDEEVTVSVTIPAGVDARVVNEAVYRAVWLSEVTPLGTVTLLEGGTPQRSGQLVDPVPGVLGNGTTLSVRAPDTRSDADPAEHATYVALTERWGERPVDG